MVVVGRLHPDVAHHCLLQLVDLLPHLLLHLVSLALEEDVGLSDIGDLCEAAVVLMHELIDVDAALGQPVVDRDGGLGLWLVIAGDFLLALVTWLLLLILLLSAGVEDHVGSVSGMLFRARLHCWLGLVDGVVLGLGIFNILILDVLLLGSGDQSLGLLLCSFASTWYWLSRPQICLECLRIELGVDDVVHLLVQRTVAPGHFLLQLLEEGITLS